MASTTCISIDLRRDPVKVNRIAVLEASSGPQTPTDEPTQQFLIEVIDLNTDAPEVYYPEGGLRAYSVVLGSFIGLVATFGTLNSVGAIQTYVSTHQLAGVKTSTISWIFSIYIALSFANCMVVGPLFDVKGALMPMVVGTLMIFGGFMAVANCTTVVQFIFALSICVALGNSLTITPLVGVISHWFNLKRGRALGLATIGGSVGGIVVPLMLESLYDKVGFAWAIRVLAFFCLGCHVTAIILCRERISLGGNTREDGKNEIWTSLVQIKDQFEFRALLDMKYLFCIIGTFFTEIALLSMVTYLATYAISKGMTESKSYILLTIFNATGVLGRLVPGILADKFGHFNVMISMLIGFSLSMVVLWLPFGSNHRVLYAFTAICGVFSSSILSLTPVCLGGITPVHKFGQRYGLLYFFVSLGNLFGIPVSAAIIGKGTLHQYDMFALFCCIFGIVGTCCWYVSRFFIVGWKLNVRV
ncbi:putative transporter MCH4 [Candida viswanathii]|uniref:Putative transporter MCH4 n=1 Tax=Candida viswanathii TaxID=5486 RepID=A0A367Y4I6_9ASCO|nr:putative transporter MCH4 [Candida viswanathii]